MEQMTLDLKFDEDFQEFEITLEAGNYDEEQLVGIFFNHPDTWVDHDETGVYVYNDTIAPSGQVGSIMTKYDDDGQVMSYTINREYI